MPDSRMKKRFLDCKGMDLREAEQWGQELAEMQRDIHFWCGDLARYSESKWPEKHHQVWPEWVSAGMLARCAGVCRAYPKETDRETEATYTQYMQQAGRPDRQQRLEAIQGITTDESRKAEQDERAETRPRWLLAIDVHLFVNQWYHSGSGFETAQKVSEWVQRTVDRLREKGLSDAVCCFDSQNNFRKVLTEDWDDQYKGNRGPKDHDLVHQLHLARQLLEGLGFSCLIVDGYESDDIMASFAVQFPGKVTLLSSDKDVRMCLSDKCNLLRDVEWIEDETSGELMPLYHWVTAKTHTKDGCPYNSVLVKGIRPDQWNAFQTLAGDPVDNVSGAHGIGAKIASDLIKEFGTAEAAIEAAKNDDERIKPRRRESLIAFESKLEVTRQLVTLVDSLTIPQNTRV